MGSTLKRSFWWAGRVRRGLGLGLPPSEGQVLPIVVQLHRMVRRISNSTQVNGKCCTVLAEFGELRDHIIGGLETKLILDRDTTEFGDLNVYAVRLTRRSPLGAYLQPCLASKENHQPGAFVTLGKNYLEVRGCSGEVGHDTSLEKLHSYDGRET